MRKGLLMLCLSASLGSVQIMASGVNDNLPDSVYTYQGKNKTLYSGALINYDEAGRKILEEGYFNRNGDDVLDENDQAYRIEYIYTEVDGRLRVEETSKQLENLEWKDYTQVVQIYDVENPDVPIERYDYSAFNNRWLLFANTIGTEFDEKGLPVVLMDTIFDVYPVIQGTSEVATVSEVVRFEVTYNNDRMPEILIEFTPDDDWEENGIWTPFRKREYIYDGRSLMNDNYFYYDENVWAYSYTYTYTYDEKGNRTSMIRLNDGSFGSEVYYENIYMSGENPNEIITDSISKAKISIVDGWLRVILEDDMSFNVSVYSMQGVLVAQQDDNHHEADLDMSNAIAGVYIVRVASGSYIQTLKFLKK